MGRRRRRSNVPATTGSVSVGSGRPKATEAPAATVPLQPLGAGAARRVLVIGGGLSGAAVAWSFRKQHSSTEDLIIHVWDGARGCGGRLATARIAVPGQDGSAVEARANMGAQHLHYGVGDEPAAGVAERLCVMGVLRPSALEERHFIPVSATNDVCKRLLSDAAADLRFGARVRTICRVSTEGRDGWAVTAFGDRASTFFDAVVFCGSVAEVMTTHGDLDTLVRPHRQRLQAVRYTRSCCAALVFKSTGKAASKILTAFFGSEQSRAAKHSGGTLCELVYQPTNCADGCPDIVTVVAVSTEAFGRSVRGLRATHRPSAQDRQMSNQVLQQLTACACAELVAGSADVAVDQLREDLLVSKLNYWKFSRVETSCSCKPAEDFLLVSEAPPLALSGDYFEGGPGSTVGTFGGCIRSASAAALRVFQQLQLSVAAPQQSITLHTSDLQPTAKSCRVLVVGGGLSGALTAHLLKHRCQQQSIEVVSWEMARGAGGRMSTTRWSPDQQPPICANTGAQYISASPKHATAYALVQEAVDAGLLIGPLQTDEVVAHSRCFHHDSKCDFSAPKGTSAVVKHFAAAADCVHYETRLQSLEQRSGRWVALSNSRSKQPREQQKIKRGRGQGRATHDQRAIMSAEHVFDAVVLAMPPRDAQRVNGSAAQAVKSVRDQLDSVRWTGRFSIALWWTGTTAKTASEFIAGVEQTLSTSSLCSGGQHSASNEPAQRILDTVVRQPATLQCGHAYERGLDGDDICNGVSVVIQSTSEFWSEHSGTHAGGGRGNGRQAGGGASAGRLDQVKGKGRGVVSAAMLQALQALCPGSKMPPPAHVKMLNWRTSQVVSPSMSTTPSSGPCVVACSAPTLVLAGDWCTESSFEGCVMSASAAANVVLKSLA